MAVGPSPENVWLDSAARSMRHRPLPHCWRAAVCSRRKNPCRNCYGEEKPWKTRIIFLHVTDTHLCRCRGPRHMLHRAGASEPLPDGICVRDHRPAFVLITGDLVHEGTSADYARAKTLLQELDEQYHTKTYPALGNHDNRENFNSAGTGF